MSFLASPVQLNLTVDESLKTEGKVYAAGQRRSLSQLFSDWLRPRIKADKQANPERYGDRPQPAAIPTAAGGGK